MKSCIRSWQLVVLALLSSSQVVAQTFAIDWNTTYQTIDGFEASDAWFADEWEKHDQQEVIGESNTKSDFSVSSIPSPLATSNAEWRTEEDMLQRRGEHANAIVNGKLYVMGGIANSKTGPRAVEVYDFTTDQWTTVSQLPVHKNHFTIGASVYGNEIWVCGGKPNGPGSGGSKSVNIYNTTTNAWRTGPDLPEDHWAGPAVIVGKKLHVLSGGKGKFGATDHHFVLDLTKEAAGWRTLKKVPKPRVHGAGVAFEGKIWFIGGEFSHAHTGDTKTVQVYDPRTNTWKLNVPQLPEARSHHEWATFVHENKIYSVSGVNSAKKPRGQATIYVYSKAAGRWNRAFDLPGKLVSPGAKIYRGRMYVFGGGVNDWFEGDMVSMYSRKVENKRTPSPKPPSINQTAVIVSKANPSFTLQVNNKANQTSAVVEARDNKGQVWTISDRGNGFHKIVNSFANKALEAWQRNPRNGDDITIYSTNNKDWQQWEFIEAGNGYFRIKGKYNPRFMTLSNGNAVMLNENGQDEQLWQLEAVEESNARAAHDPKEAFISDEAGAAQDAEVRLFPNPARQTVAVQLPVSKGRVLVTLVDFTGREVLRQWQTGSSEVRLSVQSLPRGLYHVRVQQADKVVSQKLLIE